jgi:hypothetical protein
MQHQTVIDTPLLQSLGGPLAFDVADGKSVVEDQIGVESERGRFESACFGRDVSTSSEALLADLASSAASAVRCAVSL